MRLVKIALLTLAICLGIPAIIFGIFFAFPRLSFSILQFGKYLVSPNYKNLTSIDGGNIWYECSKPVKAKKTFELVGHLGGSAYQFLYLPSDSDLKNYCHMNGIE